MLKAQKKIQHYFSTLGLRGTLVFLFAKLTGTQPVFRKRLKGISQPVFVRVGTTDASVMKQVLVERHYDVPLPLVPKLIIDAGANIGLSAVFFANKYPESQIIAIEPQEANFQMLKRNVACYSQVKPLRATFWRENGQIFLYDPGAGDHGFQVGLNPSHPPVDVVQALTVDTLLEQSGFSRIDILKIDIEGAEKEVFECSAKWMNKVEVVMTELHDQIKPGCELSFLEATKEFPERFTNGETFVCTRGLVEMAGDESVQIENHLSMPLVSVIIPTYNIAEYIAEAIDAILAQTFCDIEVLIIDDCSNDGTQTIVEDYASRDSRIISILKEKNEGPASVRNTGMKNSRGEFIAFCDADDVWDKNKLELQLDVFATHKDYDVVYSDSFIINSKGEKTGKKFSEKYPAGKKLSGNLFDELCLTNTINTQTVIMKKKCIRSAGYFPEEIRGLEDWVYWVKVAEKHKFFYINQPLARYRVHEKSINRNHKTFIENRIKAIHSILKTFPNMKRSTKSKLYYALYGEYFEIGDKNNGKDSIIQSVRYDPINIKSWYRLLLLLFRSRSGL